MMAIAESFQKAKSKGNGALIGYVTVGDPTTRKASAKNTGLKPISNGEPV